MVLTVAVKIVCFNIDGGHMLFRDKNYRILKCKEFFLCFVLLFWVFSPCHASTIRNQGDSTQSTRTSTPSTTVKAVAMAASVPSASEPFVKQEDGAAGFNSDKILEMSDLYLGTMSYTFPIKTPEGRNGMQPSLRLRYHSNRGNSWVGVGWDLNLGSIQLNPKKGVDYNSPSYLLATDDGSSELVFTGGSTGDQYKAKIESNFSRIRKIAGSDGFPYWEVTDKKGLRYTYGKSDSCRQYDVKDSTKKKIFKWCLERIDDTDGNYLTIMYVKDSGEIYPSQIDYTKHSSGIASAYSVVFNLDSNRLDKVESYISNFLVTTAKRLSSIVIKANGVAIKTFTFNYVQANGNNLSLLNTVTEKGSDNVSTLPVTTFSYSQDALNFNISAFQQSPAYGNGDITRYLIADVNGDGKADIVYIDPNTNIYVALSDGSTFGPFGLWKSGFGSGTPSNYRLADVNGDGKADIVHINTDGSLLVALSDGAATFGATTTVQRWESVYQAGADPNRFVVGDFNGDGKADLLYLGDAGGDAAFADLALSTTTTTPAFNTRTNVMPTNWGPASPFYYFFGDYNGNGRTDMVFANDYNDTWGELYGAISTGSSFQQLPGGAYPGLISYFGDSYGVYYRIGDYNGDGKKDLLWISTTAALHVGTSTGAGFVGLNGNTSAYYATGTDTSLYYYLNGSQWGSMGNASNLDYYTRYLTADVNGDGKTDVVYVESDGGLWVALSKGQSFSTPVRWGVFGDGNSLRYRIADVNGDGKADIVYINTSGAIAVALSGGETPNLLTMVDNGQGGTIKINYLPSTAYQNTQLPVAIPTVESITYNDGNGTGTESKYEYTRSGGYYHFGDREFRGFRQVTVSGPMGDSGERAVQKLWFHQGNETGIDDNDPSAVDGYMKGKPARIQVEDGNGNIYTKKEIVYQDNPSPVLPPYFNPPRIVTSYQCDGSATCKRMQVSYGYDIYGNVNSEDYVADMDDSTHKYDRTVVRTFTQQESSWIVGLPLSEITSTKTVPVTQVAKTEFFYDATSCSDTSHSIIPVKGKLTAVKYWLRNDDNPSVDISPEVRLAYDQYGNLACTKDARLNTTAYTYDASYKLFLSTVSYPIAGFPSSQAKYYGIDISNNNGQFGQIYQAIDPNGKATTFTYDPFGRKTSETLADNFTTQWQYTDFGGVGVQNVKTWNSAGIWSYSYFDGLKRLYYTRKSGPDNTSIASRTIYDKRGKISRQAVPFFESDGEKSSSTYAYDPIGRVIQVTNPDLTTTQTCYNNWITVTIDENKHRKRYVNNAYGNLIEVDEYTGVYPSCTSDLATPYAKTLYDYDVLGNLTTVTDAKQHSTNIAYDTLSRKTSMTDPDMGTWSYTYWPNGLLKSRKDANGDQLTFDYDNINRQTRKNYLKDSSYVELAYDDTASENGWGRLTKLTNRDKSVTTKYSYDQVGRVKTLTKTLGTASYPIGYAYVNGRLDTITYPNNEKVAYTYNAEALSQVRDPATNYNYATYSGYNALLQAGNIVYGNGINTAYQYYPENNRLKMIFSSGLLLPQSLIFNYDYYDNGNVKNIVSSQSSIPTTLETISYALSPTKAHRIDSISATSQIPVTYDNNGNMTSVGQLQMKYDEDNMITSANNNAVLFTYDGAGKRVIKQANGNTRTYIENLYECLNGNNCGTYIYAGNERVALKKGTDIFYYHKDHLGSTAMISDKNGNKIEYAYYQPYGETTSDSANPFTHKFTGQEQDSETGLYNYNARFYYPYIGRFVSPDTIVPNPVNPQSLNRYAYVLNNPLRYTDPTGHETEGGADGGGYCSDGDMGSQISSWGGGSGDTNFGTGGSLFSGADAAMNFGISASLGTSGNLGNMNFTNESGNLGFTGTFSGLSNAMSGGLSSLGGLFSGWSQGGYSSADSGPTNSTSGYSAMLNSPSVSNNGNNVSVTNLTNDNWTTFKNNFVNNYVMTNQVIFDDHIKTLIGFATSGTVARVMGTVTPLTALSTLARTGSMSIANLPALNVMASSAVNIGVNGLLVAGALKAGIFVGSGINAAIQTYLQDQ